MHECICSSCKNLKSVIVENEDDSVGITEECEFGFPAEACSECELEGCELTCAHYISDQEEEKFIISKCAKCGIELKLVSKNDEVGEVYCVACYLTKK